MSSPFRVQLDRKVRVGSAPAIPATTALLGLLALLWAWPGNASAATQLGQLPPGNAEFNCYAGSNLAQLTVASGTSYEVPSPGGVITRWQHKGYNSTGGGGYPSGAGRLQVWRPAGGANRTLVGRSDLVPFTAGGLSGIVEDFATRIPVGTGDLLGLRIDQGSSSLGCTFGPLDPGNTQAYENGMGGSSDPAVGETRTFTTLSQARVNVSATLEPDADGDGFGDETQDTPEVRLGGSKKQSSTKAVKVVVSCDIACKAKGKGKVKIPSAGGSASTATASAVTTSKLKPSSAQVPAGGKVTLRLKLTKKARKLAKQAISRGKKAKAKVTVTVTAGTNVSSAVRKITIG